MWIHFFPVEVTSSSTVHTVIYTNFFSSDWQEIRRILSHLPTFFCHRILDSNTILFKIRIPLLKLMKIKKTENKTIRSSFTSVVDLDPDPHGSGTFAWIRIQQKVKEHINKTVNLDCSIELRMANSR